MGARIPSVAPSVASAVALTASIALAAACSESATPHVTVATSLALPRAVLDHVTKLTIVVRDGSVDCDTSTGLTTFPTGASAAKEISRSDLASTGCAAGIRFCGDLTIEKAETPRVFSAIASGDNETTLAVGCATAIVNQDSLPLAITMYRFIEPPNCADAVLQPQEQCLPGGTAVCDSLCTTNELLLSVGSTQNGTQTGGPADKTDPFLLWPEQSGLQGRFFAFYTDRAVTGANNVEVSLRAMTDDLSPIDASESPALAAGSIYLPNGATFPSPPAPRQQSAPQAAFLKGKYYVAFQDDTGTASGLDIHLRSMDSALVADQSTVPLGINGGPAGTGGAAGSGAGEPLIQSAPAIAAGPKDRLFVAWADEGEGKIAGRTLSPPSTLGNQNDLSTGNGNRGVSVAATTTGWVAVWQSGTGVKLRVVNEDGTPQGSEQTVNDAGSVTERPRVASLADGRFAVTWSASGDIFVQRYDLKGARIAGDQTSPINDIVKDGEQTTPSIAGSSAASGSYVVVWLDATSSNVEGRMLGGTTGFLFNHVNGQSTEFQASRSTGRTRKNPTVAAGGAGPSVAVAWEDLTAPGAGIVARRFPPPSE